MKNNKGMTMIEVVVVMALIAIVTSGTVLSVSSLRRARVKKQFDVLQSQTINLREKTLTSSDLTAGAVYYDSAEGEYYFAVFEMERSKLASYATNRSNGKLVNNKDYSENGKLNVYVKNSSLEKTFAISCSTGRIVDYN